MANLSSVQSQIDILNSGTEYQKKQVLELKNIQDVRTFIAEKKGKPGWESHEKSFQDWENLISKYNIDKGAIVAGTAEAVSGTPRPQNSVILEKSISFFDNNGNLVQGKQLSQGKMITLILPPIEKVTTINRNNRITLRQVMLDDQKIWVWKGDIPSDVATPTQTPSTPPQVVGAIGPSQSTGVDEIREKLQDLTPENLEQTILLSERIINLIPSKEMQYTLRGVHGTIIIQALRQAGHNLVLRNNQIEIIPKPGVDIVNLSEKLQTLVNTRKLPIESLKVGLLYGSKTFEDYSNLKKIKDANGKYKVDPSASMNDYIQYIQDRKKAGDTCLDDETTLESRAMLSGVDMQRAIRGFQDLGQVQALLCRPTSPGTSTIPLLAGTLTPPASGNALTNTPPSTPPVTGALQNGANVALGTGGKFAGEVASNIGGFAGGVSQALGEAFNKGGPIGGLAVSVIAIMGAWKFLTGEWGTKNHKLSGWMIALGAFGGKAAWDMMKQSGLIDEAKDAAGNVIKPKPAGTSPSSSPTSATPVTPENSSTKPTEKIDLTHTQIEATKRINTDDYITNFFTQKRDKYIATKDQYITIINKELKDKPISVFLNPKEPKHSITSIVSTLDPSITIPTGMDPAILKYMLRVYVLGLSLKPSELVKSDTQIKGAISKFDIANDTLLTATKKTYNIPETVQEDIPKKIQNYDIVMNQKILPKDNLNIQVNVTPEGGYLVPISIIDPSKLEVDIIPDSVEPFKVNFDKDGKLETTTLKIKAKVGPLTIPKNYTLSQNGNQILMQESK